MKNKMKIIPWIWTAGGWLWAMWYQIVRGKEMLDADMSAEMILADLLNKEHAVFCLSKNWYYSTALRFVETDWLYRLGLLISPNNWHVARCIAIAIVLLLLIFAVWYVFYLIGRPDWGAWAAALSIFPGGGWYFWQTIYGGFYTTFILISLFSIILILQAKKNFGRKRGLIFMILFVLLGLAAGLNGIKQLMVFYSPLCITAFIILMFELREYGEGAVKNKAIFKTDAFRFALLSVIATVAAFAGYLINSAILSKIYHYKQYGDTMIEYQGFLECVKMFIWSFGFASEKVMMSPTGIASMCGIMMGLAVIASGARVLMRFKKLSFDERIISVLSAVSIIFCCFIFSFLGEDGDIQYFQLVIPMGYFLIVMEAQTEDWCKEGTAETTRHSTGFFIMNMVMLVMLIISMGTVHNEKNGPFHTFRARPTIGPVVDMLVDMGYTQGIANFWTADLVTELSDGKIEMWTMSRHTSGEWAERLQKADHVENPPQGRYFYLFDLTQGEENAAIDVGMEYINSHPDPDVLVPIYQGEDFIVYGN